MKVGAYMKKVLSIIFYIIAILFLGIYLIIDNNSRIMLSEVGRMFFLCGSCIFLYFGGLLLSKYKNNNKYMKTNLWIFFILYLLLLITLTLFDSSWGRNGFNTFNLNIKDYLKNNTNLIPFKTIIDYINKFNSMYPTKQVLLNLIGNLAAFAPMAIFLPLLFMRQNKFKNYLITNALIILSIELLQLITASGRFDIDDFILNLLGSILMYGVIKIKSVNNLIRNIFLLEKIKITIQNYIKIFISLIFVFLTSVLIVKYRNKLYNDNVNDYVKRHNPKIEIIDETKYCSEALEKFYEDALFIYYYPCIKSDNVYAVINDNEKYLIKDILNNDNFIYIVDINKIIERFDYYNIQYIKDEKYNKINFNIKLNSVDNVYSAPNYYVIIENNDNLEVKFNNRNAELDDHEYNIDLYLIPKNEGNTKIKVVFKNNETGEVIESYNYNVVIDENMNISYNLIGKTL